MRSRENTKAQIQARATTVQEDESRENRIWCYLTMTIEAISLMLIRLDYVNNMGLGDGQKTWLLLVMILMRQLAKLQLRENKTIHRYFIRAQELVIRLHYAGDEFFETLFNAMVLNGLQQRYEQFLVQ